MAKTKQPSYNETKKTTKVVFLDEYRNLNTWKMTHINQAFIDAFARDMLAWASDHDKAQLKISDFYLERGVSNDTMMRWIRKFDNLKDAYDAAKMIIGNRREKGGLKNYYNASLVATSMVHYDPEWREFYEWKSKLRQNNEQYEEKKMVIELRNFNEESKPTPEEVASKVRRHNGKPSKI